MVYEFLKTYMEVSNFIHSGLILNHIQPEYKLEFHRT